jgi:hypothetical protein
MSRNRTIERIDLDVLLECLTKLDGLAVTSITKDEKPDFIITCGGKKIGVEHTRAVYQEVVRAGKLHFSECPNSTTDQTDLIDREERRSTKQILATMTNPFGSWRKVEDCRLDWKNKIAERLRSKRQKYNHEAFQILDENWLLIHDFPPLPAWPDTHNWAGRCLRSLFSESLDVTRDFDVVFVHSGQYLFRWHRGELDLANTALVQPLTIIETAC